MPQFGIALAWNPFRIAGFGPCLVASANRGDSIPSNGGGPLYAQDVFVSKDRTMASPFRIFRKHQRMLMAVLGIMAIIAFTLLGVVLDILQSREKQVTKNPVVVTTEKYGKLRLFDLQRMQWERETLRHFLQEAVRQAGGNEMLVWYKLNQLEQTFGDISEESVVRQWLVVRRAEELNMVVTDFTITKYLRDVTDNRLTNPQIADLYRRFGIPEEVVFNVLHDHLLAAKVMDLFGVSLGLTDTLTFRPASTTPAERWDYYQRLNRNVELEVTPVSVAQFIDDKEDPGDAVLQEFFEKYKNNAPSPNSPDPGFREPPKVAIEYVKAELEKFIDPASITEEEIKDYYEKNREHYRNVELPGLGLDQSPAAAQPPAATGGSATGGAPPATGKQTELPGLEEPASSKRDVKGPQETEKKPASTDAPAAKPDEQPTTPPKTESLHRAVRTPFRLVSTGQQPGAETTPPADQKPAAAEDTAPKPVYKPLEEVKDDIRRKLAGERVRQRILQAFQPIRANMNNHYRALIAFETTKEEKSDEPAPPPIELAPLADPPPGTFWVRKGWKLISADEAKALKPEEVLRAERFGPPRKTELAAVEELAALDIAASRTEGEQPFLNDAFSAKPLYLPEISWDEEGNAYLFWKTDETEEHVPKFDDEGVRDKVLAAWRFVQARDAARKHAEKLANEARDSGKSLAESIGKQPGVNVSTTGPFTWMTSGTLPAMQSRNLRISAVDHVDKPGNEFMRAAYNLKVGEIGVAMNFPQNTVYVMRLVGTNPLEKVLMASFEVDQFGKYSEVAQGDFQKVVNAWFEQLETDAGLKWERPAAPPPPRRMRGQ